MAIDKNGIILHSMDSFSSWIGSSSKNLVGKRFYDLVTELDPTWKMVLDKTYYQNSLKVFFRFHRTNPNLPSESL